MEGTVARNVLAHGVGGLNIDGCRVPSTEPRASGWSKSGSKAGENVAMSGANYARDPKPDDPAGRWPPNILHDGSPEVLEAFGRFGDRPGQLAAARNDGILQTSVALGDKRAKSANPTPRGDSGSAAR